MGRAKKNKPRRQRSSATEAAYVCGVEGVVIRQARPGEGRQVLDLLSTIDTDYDDLDYAGQHIDAGTYVTSGAGLRRALVAEEGAGLVGALLALPPGSLLSRLQAAKVPRSVVSGVARSIAKLKAVAVAPERRGDGIGEALVRAFVDEYGGAGYDVLYAQVDIDKPALARWYGRLGFEALGAGGPLRLDPQGRVAIYPLDGEQLVVRELT
ncbi:GNAT family N-acetyltransferase [Streptomyces sp. NPDC091215]|uniref:GNAT family N-acetyltransferase n=1 Tax=Streptomyces sp. NPDC091215 TaxID=3155192 RepID=UPI00342DBB81